MAGLDSGQVTTWTSWHRWTAISLLACAFLDDAAACQRALDAAAGTLAELIPVTIPELLWQLKQADCTMGARNGYEQRIRLPVPAFRSLARTKHAQSTHGSSGQQHYGTARRNTHTAIYQGKRIGEAPPGTVRQARAPHC